MHRVQHPRKRNGGGETACGSTPSLDDLPNLALARVLELTSEVPILSQEDRLSRLCLVCRRWYDRCHGPLLLHRVEAFLPRSGSADFPSMAEAERDLKIFEVWMQRHGHKITELFILCMTLEPPPTAAQQRRLQRLAFACLSP